MSRFKADVTPKSRQTDVDSRIGAFEIQVAYKSPSGVIHPEILHSKLWSRRWPSKSVLEKRLQSFFSKVGAKTMDSSLDANNAEYSDVGCEGLAEYPVGFGPWQATLLADPAWKYPGEISRSALVSSPTGSSKDNKASKPLSAPSSSFSVASQLASFAAGASKPGTTAVDSQSQFDASPEDSAKTNVPNIQWVFDSRAVASASKFAVGATLWVLNVQQASGLVSSLVSRERHGLLGVVKKVFPATEHRNASLSVRLKYHGSEITVPEDSCFPNSYRDPASCLDQVQVLRSHCGSSTVTAVPPPLV